ncbi:MAG: outer membrane protein assembly factor BamA [Candidatus Delongbacteria bacterium]|nr:outer membrane protein assembly factor BamA [Candidatus Delongbacteria bacterium]
MIRYLIIRVMILIFAFTSMFANEMLSDAVNAVRISDIEFYNIYPFFSNELLDRISLYPGNVYDKEDVEEQTGILKEYLKAKGYDSVKVDTEAENVSDKLRKLHIKVTKTGYTVIRNIEIEGNTYYSDIRLKKELNTYWRSFLPGEPGRFIPDSYEEDIKTLRDFYREKGFAEAEVTGSVIHDPIEHKSDIIFKVNEGPKYKVILNGNDFFSKRALREQIDLIYKGRRASVAARQIVRGIRNRYKEEGFNDVRVDWNDSLFKCGDIECGEIRVYIKEGPRTLISEIGFDGNAGYEGKELKQYLNSVVSRWWRFSDHFDERKWEDDERNLTAFYAQNGYLSAKVKGNLDMNRNRDSLVMSFKIDEGIRTLVGEVSYEGSYREIKPELESLSSELKDIPYNSDLINERTSRIKGILASKGFIYAQVKNSVKFSSDSSKADVVFSIQKKNIAATGRIYNAGNLKTKEKTIKKLLPLKEGEPFSILGLSKGQRNLRNQKIFRSVSAFTPGIESKKDTIDILINVEEYPPYFFQAAGGYESYLGPYLSLSAGNKNLFGMNKEISIKTEASFVRQAATLTFIEPVLFSVNLAGNISSYWEKGEEDNLDFETEAFGLGTGVGYRWESKLQTSLQVQVEQKELFLQSTAGEDSNIVKNTGRLRISQLWDGRDSFMVPRKGLYANLETEFSTGIDNNEDDFIKYKADLKYFLTPVEMVTFAFFGKLNYLQEMDHRFQPSVEQLFYLGGTSTVRGIANNSFLLDPDGEPAGGKLAALFAFELRLEYKNNWEIPLFTDNGFIGQSPGADDTFRTTVGSGLRYVTPIGAMGILYGFPTDIKDGWKQGAFHFSIGYTF